MWRGSGYHSKGLPPIDSAGFPPRSMDTSKATRGPGEAGGCRPRSHTDKITGSPCCSVLSVAGASSFRSQTAPAALSIRARRCTDSGA